MKHTLLFVACNLLWLIIYMDSACTQGTEYLFNGPICTGLGDRLGTMLALASLARLDEEGVVVWFLWCSDPCNAYDPSSHTFMAMISLCRNLSADLVCLKS